MSTLEYRCPSCGAPLEYEAQSGKLFCTACSSRFDLDLLEGAEENAGQEGIHFDRTGGVFDAQDAEHICSYICQSCGAELMTEETTTATQCPYCGSPTVLPERIEGGVKPERVVPFVVTKEQAQKQFEEYFKGKKLLPNVFLNSRNRITEMRRLYVPYWLFDCTACGDVTYNAQKKHIRREGDWEVTYTEHYLVRRAGSMAFEHIPVDGSEKLDNKITESLEPYDLSAAVEFEPAVLAGAMADRADVDGQACEARARERVESSMEQALRNTVSGYSAVSLRSRRFFSESGRVTPVLLPVWLITTEKEGKTYTFAINGQTGRLTCDVPADTGKSLLWGGGVFALVLLLACAALYASGMLEGMTMLFAAFAALLVSAGVVAALTAQLKRAVSASAAGNYVVNHSFNLMIRRDCHLHTTQTRRRIEQSAQQGPPRRNGPRF
ncbi:MAG: hypothetical protein IKV90_09120 [Clostridia bacterium]|nr:hypothetical protein [Clostridia bacterium]